jgi:succinate-acetate transporter protein
VAYLFSLDDPALMLDWLLRGLVVAVLRRVFVVLAAPVVFVIAMPFILLRACVLSARHEETFKCAVLDAFGSVWDGLVAAFMWPCYGEMDRIEAARRQSSNQSLDPTAGGRTEKLKNEL